MAESSGNGPQRPTQNRLGGANSPMAKTIVLVVVALIVGIVLINIVDNGTTSKSSPTTVTTLPGATTTTTRATGPGGSAKTTTTTAKKTAAVVPPASLNVFVVNSGAPTGSGGNISAALRTRGYTHQPHRTAKLSWSETGLTVHCKPGLERERAALVSALAGVPNYHATAVAWTVKPGVAADVQCYVAIGAVA